jgi:hypothetical protein
VAVGIPADLVRRRPDVRRAERNAAAQAEQIGIAESDFYPQLSLNGTFSYSAQEFQQLFNQSALYGSWGPAFQWNLLNYGRILNNVRAQDAMFQELVAHYQNTVLNASQEVENGLVTFLKSQVQARFMADSVKAAEKAVVIAIAQYRGGLVDFNRVSLVEQNLVQQQNLYAQAFGSISLGLVNTYRALGGGWQIRLDPAAGGAAGLPAPDPNYRGDHVAAPMPMLAPPVENTPQPIVPPEQVNPPAPVPAPPAAGATTMQQKLPITGWSPRPGISSSGAPAAGAPLGLSTLAASAPAARPVDPPRQTSSFAPRLWAGFTGAAGN